jgi:2-dehydropantoate 2-reductase
VWNIPYNGLSLVMGRDGSATDEIMVDPERRQLVEALMREVVAAANADLAAAGKSARIDAEEWVREMMARTLEMGPYVTSTLLDYRAGSPLEVDAIFAEPVRRASAAGVAVPRLEMLLTLVRQRAATLSTKA